MVFLFIWFHEQREALLPSTGLAFLRRLTFYTIYMIFLPAVLLALRMENSVTRHAPSACLLLLRAA